MLKNPAMWSEEALEAPRLELSGRTVDVPQNMITKHNYEAITHKRPAIKQAGIFLLIHAVAGALLNALSGAYGGSTLNPIVIDIFLGAWLLGASTAKVESARKWTVVRACGSMAIWPIIIWANIGSISPASIFVNIVGVILV